MSGAPEGNRRLRQLRTDPLCPYVPEYNRTCWLQGRPAVADDDFERRLREDLPRGLLYPSSSRGRDRGLQAR
jgi:hypothetical protein